MMIFALLALAQLRTVSSAYVFGILSFPSPYDEYAEEFSQVDAYIVRYIEAGGARVIPIKYTWDVQVIEKTMRYINGIIFQDTHQLINQLDKQSYFLEYS